MRHQPLLISALIAAVNAPGAFACGYQNALANSAFNAVHPKSLSVAVAIRRATDRGVLEPEPATASLPTFTGGEYRRAAGQLREIEEKLARIAPRFANGESLRFAFVFVQSRLWAEYTVHPDGASAVIHTPAAGHGETVVLSDESVLRAIVDRRLAFETAVGMGLIQFADDRDGKALQAFRSALGGDLPSQRPSGLSAASGLQ